MEGVAGVEELFEREFAPLVRALGVAFADPEAAADAVQEAFIEADRRWRRIGRYDDPAAWVRRVALNRLRNGRRDRRRRGEILAAIRPVAPTTSPTTCSTSGRRSPRCPSGCAWRCASTISPTSRSTRWRPRSASLPAR
jgi:DNA-directed RNA polymerase specialized sigma24 family protein